MARTVQEFLKIMRAPDLENSVNEQDLKEFEDELAFLTGRFGAVAKMRGYFQDPVGRIEQIIKILDTHESSWHESVSLFVFMLVCAEAADKKNELPERVTEIIEGRISAQLVVEALTAIRGNQG